MSGIFHVFDLTHASPPRRAGTFFQHWNYMNGEFPVLKPGANAISWTGTVTRVVVRPNCRYL